MLAYARNKGEEKRPNWIGENVWTALWRKWNTDAYKQKREKAKTNRASERGTSTHKGGSMSAGEIKYYMVITIYNIYLLIYIQLIITFHQLINLTLI